MEENMFKATEILDNTEGGVMLHMNRLGYIMIAVAESVIIYGRNKSDNKLTAELWIYDCRRKKWRLFILPDLLTYTCKNSSICAHGSKIYIFGVPAISDSQDIAATLFSFDVRSFMLVDLFKELINTGNEPPKMKQSDIMYDRASIYILGTNMDDVGVMYKFHLEKCQLSMITHAGYLPHPDDRGHCTLYKNKIYYFRQISLDVDQFSQVRVFDLSTRIWELRQQETDTTKYPYDRLDPALIFNDNYGYLAGGFLFSPSYEERAEYLWLTRLIYPPQQEMKYGE
ncbi:hypothetical protein RF11_13422 [Thelohanellus kitauei]|uniref:Kelch domain-containing protein 10 n=1 Tax=Thelohanellus kitauei TaxID=669202 RepID=A0A0C2MZZ4_THEKT|nr:hypothetical protein RF11_13422 [Thelohanellus kitauei]